MSTFTAVRRMRGTRATSAAWAAWAARGIAALVLIFSSIQAAGPVFAYQPGNNLSQGGLESLADCRAQGGVAWEWMAFTGHDGQLNLLQYPNHLPFSAYPTNTVVSQSLLHQYTPGTAVITCVNEPFGDLYIAWNTLSGGIDVGRIAFLGYTAYITDIMQLPESTVARPGLSSDDGHNLIVTWVGTDQMHHINVDDINLQTRQVTKYVTTDYTYSGSSSAVAWNGLPAGKGDSFTVGFLDADAPPFSGNRPFIFLGRFSPDAPSSHLHSYRTNQWSQFTPSLSPSPGLLTPAINGSGGGRIPQPGGPTEVFWMGFDSGQLFVGYWNGGDIYGAHGYNYPDDVNDSPGVDQCHTAYSDAYTHIQYDLYPYFAHC